MAAVRSRARVEGAGVLEFDDIVKHYRGGGEEVRAVDGVSLSVRPGELVALHGPSGSGKTTLLLLGAALLDPECGAVRYGGRDLAALSDDQSSDYRLREIGFVHQNPQLMGQVSALENAALKLVLGGVGMREAKARATPWLQRLGLGERLERPPERLSGGERQRIALARVLAADPQLVLADEPTANLDSARSREIVGLLRALAHEHGVGVLLVTHDTDAAALADRRCTLRDGRLLDAEDYDGDAHEHGPGHRHGALRARSTDAAPTV